MNLKVELNKFWKWIELTPSEYAVSSANGEYETEYQNWDTLLTNTEITIQNLNKNYNQEEIELLNQVLAIDNECEVVMDLIKTNLKDLESFCTYVMSSIQFHSKWQVAELLGNTEQPFSKDFLIRIINNKNDNYVIKRALLSLHRKDIPASIIEAINFLNSEDEYLRRISNEINKGELTTGHNIS